MIEVSYEISHSGNSEQSLRFSKELPQVFQGLTADHTKGSPGTPLFAGELTLVIRLRLG